MSSKKSQNIDSLRKSQEGELLQIWVGYLDWDALQRNQKGFVGNSETPPQVSPLIRI
jgi:hypothetical protein